MDSNLLDVCEFKGIEAETTFNTVTSLTLDYSDSQYYEIVVSGNQVLGGSTAVVNFESLEDSGTIRLPSGPELATVRIFVVPVCSLVDDSIVLTASLLLSFTVLAHNDIPRL